LSEIPAVSNLLPLRCKKTNQRPPLATEHGYISSVVMNFLDRITLCDNTQVIVKAAIIEFARDTAVGDLLELDLADPRVAACHQR
jgi:hypothetical protein